MVDVDSRSVQPEHNIYIYIFLNNVLFHARALKRFDREMSGTLYSRDFFNVFVLE